MEKDKEEEILEKIRGFYEEGLQGSEDKFTRAMKGIAYKRGGEFQWDNDVLAQMIEDERPVVTINRSRSTVQNLVGMFEQNEKDIRVFSRPGTMQVVCDILSDLVKHADDVCHAHHEEVEQFDDGCTGEEGYILVKRVRDEQDPRGYIVSERVNQLDVIVDPDGKHYNPNVDAKYMCYGHWVDKDKTDAQYPGKKDELREGDMPADAGMLSRAAHWVSGFVRGQTRGTDDREERLKKHRYFRVDVGWKEYKPRVSWQDRGNKKRGIEGGRMVLDSTEDIDKARTATEKRPKRFNITEGREREYLRHGAYIDDLLLEFAECGDAGREVAGSDERGGAERGEGEFSVDKYAGADEV